MKRIIYVLIFGLLFFSCKEKNANQNSNSLDVAKNINLDDPLPEDKACRKGVLENGMTYYLYNTEITKGAASYYIIQNVGSILENEDQKGLAHFLEHMAFNGTKNFKGKEILNKLRENGLVFGRDINAYTTAEETVYNINNLSTTLELIDTGLLILHDWSNYLLLTDEEIDLERGVIKEEKRTRENSTTRILNKTIKTRMNNSKYAHRPPIGSMEVIENFEYKTLRDFYHNWYRTDLQAIAIIGDFNIDEMETKVKAMFSSIPKAINAPKRTNIIIEDNNEILYDIATDSEMPNSNIQFCIRHPRKLENQTFASLKEELIREMLYSLFFDRFENISKQPESPFVFASYNYAIGALARKHNDLCLSVNPKPNMQHKAFELLMREFNRVQKFGFTNSEIKNVKNRINVFYENEDTELRNRSHGKIANTIKKNYLENISITDIREERKAVKMLLNEISSSHLVDFLQKKYTKKNRSIIVTGIKGENNLTKDDAINIIEAAENDNTLKPYQEEKEIKDLMVDVNLKPGKIISEEINNTIGSTFFTLSNNIKVHYKFVDKIKNKVELNAVSKGGKSLIADNYRPSADRLSGVIDGSGLHLFSEAEIKKILSTKKLSHNIFIDELEEGMYGESSTKDVETLLQLTNLRFTKPRFDKNSYEAYMQFAGQYAKLASTDINSIINNKLLETLYGKNHPIKYPFNEATLSKASFEKVKSIYKDRFSNAADFTFFIVGDVSKDVLKPLLEKYLASIPTNIKREDWKDKTPEWRGKNIDKDVFITMKNSKASVKVSIKNELTYNLKNEFIVRAISDILKLRYLEFLREEEGGVYGVGVWGSLSKRPIGRATLSISFDCNPNLVEKLVSIVHREIELIKIGKIEQDDLDVTLTSYLKNRKEIKSNNSYQMDLLKNYVFEGYNMDDPKNFENIIKSITIKDIQKVMLDFLNDSDSYEIVFKPKK